MQTIAGASLFDMGLMAPHGCPLGAARKPVQVDTAQWGACLMDAQSTLIPCLRSEAVRRLAEGLCNDRGCISGCCGGRVAGPAGDVGQRGLPAMSGSALADALGNLKREEQPATGLWKHHT